MEEWTPEPLVSPPTAFEKLESENLPVIVGPTGPKTKLSNGRTVTNLASYNFYNFVGNEQVKEKAIQTLPDYYKEVIILKICFRRIQYSRKLWELAVIFQMKLNGKKFLKIISRE